LPSYEGSLLDWMACAYAGRGQGSVAAAAAAGDTTTTAGTAGHVLDFDDTYLPGLAHLSAPVAPVVCVLGAEVDADGELTLGAYVRGFEAMAAVAAASHPALYRRGLHPTAVCGVVGAATAAAHLLDLHEPGLRNAVGLGLLRTGGLLAAFGSPGKALQVGLAASTGVWAARAAHAGATVPSKVWEGFERAYGATWAEPDGDRPAIDMNWIKAYPCCLQTHSAIEAADAVRTAGGAESGPMTVVVHPVTRRAAPYDDVSNGLEAKFSVPYLVAHTLKHGPPTVTTFDSVDVAIREASHHIAIETDTTLAESEAIIRADDGVLIRVEAALGSPQRPMSAEALASKVEALSGRGLVGILDDSRPGKAFLELLNGLSP
jgi:2-methylcitrate dehydratase PrpD